MNNDEKIQKPTLPEQQDPKLHQKIVEALISNPNAPSGVRARLAAGLMPPQNAADKIRDERDSQSQREI